MTADSASCMLIQGTSVPAVCVKFSNKLSTTLLAGKEIAVYKLEIVTGLRAVRIAVAAVKSSAEMAKKIVFFFIVFYLI